MWTIRPDNVQGRALMATNIITLIAAFAAFGVRIWARVITKVRINLSDYLCGISLLLCVGLVVINYAVFSHGWGLDVSQFTLDDARMSSRLSPAILTIWNSAVTTVRASILIFYIQIFAIPLWQKVYWVLITLNAFALFGVIVVTFTICYPLERSYDPTVEGHCGDLLAFQRFTAVWNLLADTAVVVAPMPVLWNLQMTKQKKIGLSIILGIGFIICVGTLTRILLVAVYEKNNVTLQNAPVVFITAMEPTLGVIIACVPMFPAVWHKLKATQASKGSKDSYRTDSTVNQKLGSSWGVRSSQQHSNKYQGSFQELDDLDSMDLGTVRQDNGTSNIPGSHGTNTATVSHLKSQSFGSAGRSQYQPTHTAEGIQVTNDFTVVRSSK